MSGRVREARPRPPSEIRRLARPITSNPPETALPAAAPVGQASRVARRLSLRPARCARACSSSSACRWCLSLALGFFEVDGFGGYRFVGLANYRRMLADPLFWSAPRVTLALRRRCWCRRSTSAGSAWRFWCRRPTASTRVMRAMFFAPQMVSLVVVALVWQLLVVDKIGVVSRLSPLIGLGGISFLGDPELRALHRGLRQRLVPDGLLHADLPRRPAGHPERILRGGARSTAPGRSRASGTSPCRC